MRISYDKEVDALYIKLIDGTHQVHTIRLNDDIALDFIEGEKLAGIEILDAKTTLQSENFPKIILENISKEQVITSCRLGTDRQNFLSSYHSPQPRHIFYP